MPAPTFSETSMSRVPAGTVTDTPISSNVTLALGMVGISGGMSGEGVEVDLAGFEGAGQVAGQVFAQLAAMFEFGLVRHQLEAQAFDRHPELEAAQAVLDQADRLAAPAVGAEGGAELGLD